MKNILTFFRKKFFQINEKRRNKTLEMYSMNGRHEFEKSKKDSKLLNSF